MAERSSFRISPIPKAKIALGRNEGELPAELKAEVGTKSGRVTKQDPGDTKSVKKGRGLRKR
jgi:hypothetical protein